MPKPKDLLPTEKTDPMPHLRDYPILLYGRERVGKTTLCAQFEDPLFLFFEPGGKSLSLLAVTIKSWKHFKQVIEELEAKPNKFRTVVIDTVDMAHAMASEYVCKREGISHPSDMKWGKGWGFIDAAFEEAMFRILRNGRGLLFTSHSTEKDIDDLTGEGEIRRMVAPTAGTQAMRFVRRYVDLILYYYYDKNGNRWIRVRGNRDVIAGNRIDGHFKGITKFRAGASPEEAYVNLVNAFENKMNTEVANGPKEKRQEPRKRFRF